MLAKKRVLASLIIALLLLAAGTTVIFWARGFKPDFKTGTLARTGLIVASSIPTGAQVYLDNRLTSATDTNIAFLSPKVYRLRIEKDGYTTWEKDIEVKADLAVEIKALLFPTAPEIKPQTTTGALNPSLSPDGAKIIYSVPGPRGGLYVLPMSDRPFPFRQDARVLVKNGPWDFAKAQFVWRPDSQVVIARIPSEKDTGQFIANLLIDTAKTDQQPLDVTAAVTATLNSWQEELNLQAQTKAVPVPDQIKQATAESKTINSSQLTVDSQKSAPGPSVNREPTTVNSLNYYPTGLIFSPDEEKILYATRDAKYHVYDLKNKKDYALPDFPDFIGLWWYPDSNHLVLAQKDRIAIIETDGANKMPIYSGKFENGFVFPHPSGTKLIILTALTQPDGIHPNLYSINLR